MGLYFVCTRSHDSYFVLKSLIFDLDVQSSFGCLLPEGQDRFRILVAGIGRNPYSEDKITFSVWERESSSVSSCRCVSFDAPSLQRTLGRWWRVLKYLGSNSRDSISIIVKVLIPHPSSSYPLRVFYCNDPKSVLRHKCALNFSERRFSIFRFMSKPYV